MRLINDIVLSDRYDVIVVGAGLGGMAAASLLAKRGLSVLMIDQQGKPGGSCTSFRREDVTFDVGTAMLYGFGERGFKPFRFLINELEEPVEVVAHPTLARMTFEGQPITFWPDVERFLQECIAPQTSGLRMCRLPVKGPGCSVPPPAALSSTRRNWWPKGVVRLSSSTPAYHEQGIRGG